MSKRRAPTRKEQESGRPGLDFRKIIRSAYSSLTIGLLLAIVIVAAFWRVRANDFVYDDYQYILANEHVHNGLNAGDISWAFRAFFQANWHPLTWISHMLDNQLFDLSSKGPHLVNLLFHIANTLLLFYILKRMTRTLWQSAFVAALFGIHPLHVESVAWISERKDVLSTFFWMLTLLAYVHYVEKPTIKRYVLILSAFALGLLAKPMLVTLPFALLLLDYWPLKRFNLGWRLIWEKIPLMAMAAISSVITYIAQHSGEAVTTFDRLHFGIRAANAVVSYVSYLWKMIWPRGLSIIYPHPIETLPTWEVAASGLVLACISALAIRSARRLPYFAIGWFWYLGTLVPVIGLVQVGAQAMADRYTYVPLIGIFIVIAWGVPDLLARRKPRGKLLAIPAIGVILALMICTWIQVSYWRNNLTLFEHDLAYNRPTKDSLNNLAAAYKEQGMYDRAIALFKARLRQEPGDPQAIYNLAGTYVEAGRTEDAIRGYRTFIERVRAERQQEKLGIYYLNACSKLFEMLYRANRMGEAAAELRILLAEHPEMTNVRLQLAGCLIFSGHIREGRAELQTILNTAANSAEAAPARELLSMTENLPEGAKPPIPPPQP